MSAHPHSPWTFCSYSFFWMSMAPFFFCMPFGLIRCIGRHLPQWSYRLSFAFPVPLLSLIWRHVSPSLSLVFGGMYWSPPLGYALLLSSPAFSFFNGCVLLWYCTLISGHSSYELRFSKLLFHMLLLRFLRKCPSRFFRSSLYPPFSY